MTDNPEQRKSEALLPCPFCGGTEPQQVEQDGVVAYNDHLGNWFVACDFCGARSRDGDHLEQAENAWNTRAAAPSTYPPVQGEVAKLREYHSSVERLVSTWINSDMPAQFYPNGADDCDDDEDKDRWDGFVAARAALNAQPSPTPSDAPEKVVAAERFEREDRYIVFKKSRLSEEQLEKLERLTSEGPRGLPSSSHDYPLPTVECVVVESDWLEYEPVWRMIRDRMEVANG